VKFILKVIATTLLAQLAHAALPGDAAEGKRLHAASCAGCHDSSVYTRENHRVRSIAQLKQQVDNCTHMAQAQFSAAQKQDVVKYLNDAFYHFLPEGP